MKQFKYHSTFATKHIRILAPEEQSKELALASLKDLKSVLPAGLDIEGNPDLVFHSFNAFLANRINANDDGINTKDAIGIANKFIHKPEDLEHNRKFVVGTIISQGFSEFLTNRVLTIDEVKDLDSPFNITLGGVVWSIFNPDFAEELVEASDESSPKYEMISASWEIGFDDYHIALGSRDLKDAEIITDPKQIEEFQPMLRIAKGSGMTNDGVPVYRVITGEALPLGIGFTTTPAAQVKGVVVAQAKDESVQLIVNNAIKDFKENIEERIKNIESKATIKENPQNNEKISSQVETPTVKNNSNMKLKTLEDITDENLQQANAAAVRNFLGQQISEKIDEVSTQYAEKLEAKEKEAKAQKEELEKANKDLQNTLAQVTKLQDDLKKEQETRAAQKAETDFNARMSDLDSKFDLNDKDRQIIAKRIRGLDDTAFGEWLNEFEVLAEGKKKMPKTGKSVPTDSNPDPDGDGDDDRKASTDTDNSHWDENGKKKPNKWGHAGAASASTEDVLNQITENDIELPPNTTATETSVKQEFADAFNLEAFKIKK